jgi:hypothetical protein
MPGKAIMLRCEVERCDKWNSSDVCTNDNKLTNEYGICSYWYDLLLKEIELDYLIDISKIGTIIPPEKIVDFMPIPQEHKKAIMLAIKKTRKESKNEED